MKSKKLVIIILSSLLFGAQLVLAEGLPEDVTGVTAAAKDAASIDLAWKAAKDAGGGLVKNYRIYYGDFSVLEKGEGDYQGTKDTPDNNTAFTVGGLKAGTKYYFAVTAIGAGNRESERYSLEASAATKAAEVPPPAPGEDKTSPTVTSVSAPDKTHVKVVFSEGVQLPALNSETAFSIAGQISGANTLEVKKAALDADDAANKTVLLETAEQKANTNYIVTAGIAVKDRAGNPIVNGSTDTGLFLGSSKSAVSEAPSAPPSAPPAAEPPKAEEKPAGSGAEDCAKDLSCLLKHMADCSAGMATQTDDQAAYEYRIEVAGAEGENCLVKYTASKHPSILFAGSVMTCKVAKGAVKAEDYDKALDVKNCSGELADGFKTLIMASKDVTPPENVTNLMLAFKKELEKFTIMLSWTASVNTAKDLVDQLLYMSLDRGKNYDAGKSLGPSAVKTEVPDMEAGKEYTFKVTAKDGAGNESTGLVKSIRLPQTGAGIGLLLLGSAAAARRLLRRRKNQGI